MERENGKRGWIPKVWSGNTKWNGKLTNLTHYSISSWRLVFRYENTGMILNRMLNWSRMLQIRSHHWRCISSCSLVGKIEMEIDKRGCRRGRLTWSGGRLRWTKNRESYLNEREEELDTQKDEQKESIFSWLQGIKGWRQKPAFKIWDIGNRT